MKNILLLGDVIRDFNLMEYSQNPSHNHQSIPKTAQIQVPGGILYLQDLLTLTIPPEEGILFCPSGKQEENDIAVFNSWKQFPKTAKDKKKIWRIDHILGRTEMDKEACRAKVNGNIAKATAANLLVIESLGLGWLESLLSEENPIGTELLKKAQPEEIILKLSSLTAGLPFMKNPDVLNKTTVILPVQALRDRGAAISEGLSWDRTIEDTVQEFTKGLSSLDLARCRRVIVLFSAEGAAVFEKEDKNSDMRLEKFLYVPNQYEGSFKASHPGQMSGNLSLVTTAIIRHLVLGKRYPLFTALSLALTAIRKQHEEGIHENEKENNLGKRFDFRKHFASLCAILTLTDCLASQSASIEGKNDSLKLTTEKKAEQEKVAKKRETLKNSLGTFSFAFRHDFLDDPNLKDQPVSQSNLLRDATGYGCEYVAAKAFQIVMQGAGKALAKVPIASYGTFLTADREEIERINAIRKLIISYLVNPQDKRPLSLAVFGPPGSGKSFSIKQLAAELGFAEKSIRTFNLSEFKEPAELQVAFHIVRDATIQGNIPLIFWDEFDSDDLKWLKEFLAPMQDAEFRAGSVVHPLGKAIFIFAGGVFSSFEEFEIKTTSQAGGKPAKSANDEIQVWEEKGKRKEDLHAKRYEGRKAPDFISRLRGYVNIKGPNPQEIGDENCEYYIRRAILLRSLLERNCSHLRSENGQIAISAPLVQAFLRVSRYKHGARSLESLVTMSDLVNAPFFGEAALPPDHLLNLHVEALEFRKILQEETLEMPMIELISEACHMAWKKQKEEEGYQYDAVRSDTPPFRHPLMVDYRKLDGKDKESNRLTARLTQAKLSEVQLEIEQKQSEQGKAEVTLLDEKLDHLMRIEHDIWMRDHLLNGYEFSEETVDALKLHRCIRKFEDLSDDDKKLDEAIVKSLRKTLKDNGYGVKRKIEEKK